MAYFDAIDSDWDFEKRAEVALLLVKNRLDVSDKEDISFILNSRDPILLLNLMYHVHLVFAFIKTIANSGDRASQVVQNLRLFIREKRNMESGTVNIKNNIETVLNIFSHKIENQVDLFVDVDPDIHIKGYDVRFVDGKNKNFHGGKNMSPAQFLQGGGNGHGLGSGHLKSDFGKEIAGQTF